MYCKPTFPRPCIKTKNIILITVGSQMEHLTFKASKSAELQIGDSANKGS